MTEHTETMGCDLGDKQSELCILLANGQVVVESPEYGRGVDRGANAEVR